jgi:hypothetical protein
MKTGPYKIPFSLKDIEDYYVILSGSEVILVDLSNKETHLLSYNDFFENTTKVSLAYPWPKIDYSETLETFLKDEFAESPTFISYSSNFYDLGDFLIFHQKELFTVLPNAIFHKTFFDTKTDYQKNILRAYKNTYLSLFNGGINSYSLLELTPEQLEEQTIQVHRDFQNKIFGPLSHVTYTDFRHDLIVQLLRSTTSIFLNFREGLADLKVGDRGFHRIHDSYCSYEEAKLTLKLMTISFPELQDSIEEVLVGLENLVSNYRIFCNAAIDCELM